MNAVDVRLQRFNQLSGQQDEKSVNHLKSLFGMDNKDGKDIICNHFIDKWYLYLIQHRRKGESISLPSWKFCIFGEPWTPS